VEAPNIDLATVFLLQDAHATVAWGPMLLEAQQAPDSHLLTDSAERPGLFVSCLMTTTRVLSHGRDDFKARGRAWDAAVDYAENHADEAVRIMSARMGGRWRILRYENPVG
jgi:ABC-type nitrate/sulfonate/bicarbonate transport system substrate-binding protein